MLQDIIRIKLKTITLIILTAVFTSCQVKQKVENNVVCTTNIIADAARILLPEHINVISLMGAGVDPHLYKAGHQDLEDLQNAKVIVENGLHLEGKMAEVLDKLSRYKSVIKMSDGVKDSELISLGNDIYDPHIWFNVKLWRSSVLHLAGELEKAFPEDKEVIVKRKEEYLDQLLKLDQLVVNKIASIPVNQRVLVTAHDAFSYFGQSYQIEVRGLQGISTQSEFGLKDVSTLVNFLVDREVKAVFIETSVSEKSIRSVVEGCKKRGHEIEIGGKLYSDALGGNSEPGNSYVNMVNYNVETIVNALNP